MSAESSKPKILLVDDSRVNIRMVGKALGRNYEVMFAMDGEKALSLAASEPPPDLILLDIMMPGMDGYEVCGRLKQNETTKNIPVIFISAKGEEEDKAKGLELGAVDYIAKPFDFANVCERIETHLKLKK